MNSSIPDLARGPWWGTRWLLLGLALCCASVYAQPPLPDRAHQARAPAGPQDLIAKPWNVTRLSDGQPDVRGYWAPAKQGTYSLTDPSNGGAPEVIRFHQLRAQGKLTPRWPSRVIDPADGQFPYRPWARAKQRLVEAHILHPDRQEYVDPMARCLPDGVIRDPLWTGFELEQFPGYVVFLFDQVHTFRVIPLDGQPHAPDTVKLWMSDSRGHWEGHTLVVDVTNTNGKARLDNIGDFISADAHITERITFVDHDTISYEWHVDDPRVYTRPWTLWAKFDRVHQNDPGYEQWEEACHEYEHNAESLLSAEEKARAR
jgi:hypothetical protein